MEQPNWFQETDYSGTGLQEQSGWLTGCAPTNIRIVLNNFPQYWTTRQWTASTGDATVKMYNLWGQDWNNVRPKIVTIDVQPDQLSGGLEKIKIGPTF